MKLENLPVFLNPYLKPNSAPRIRILLFFFPLSLKCSLGNVSGKDHNLICNIRISFSSNSPSWLRPCFQFQICSVGCAKEASAPLQWNCMGSFPCVVNSETSQPLSSMLIKFSVVGCVTVYQTLPQRKAFALHSSIQLLLASRGHLCAPGQPFQPLLEMTGQCIKWQRLWLCAKTPCTVPQAHISMTLGILVLPKKQHQLPPAQALPW